MNTLYYGDNLAIMQRYLADESVDVVYLDPPFNSKRDYNATFTESSGEEASAQVKAFKDTWYWDVEGAMNYEQTLAIGGELAETMRAFRVMLGTTGYMAYLSMMATRLWELKRVLKPTGSIYLHCDPTMSHYLKLVMDATFGHKNFRNEIIWRRTNSTGSSKSRARRFPANIDQIFFYTKTEDYKFHHIRLDYSEKYKSRYTKYDERGAYYLDNLKTYSEQRLQTLIADNRIEFTKTGKARVKNYLHEAKGLIIDNVWTDINALNSQAAERLGYPTQKPESLLERIIAASSDEDDIILDPFCGCGTAIAVAQRLGRQWIGIDITHLAINLIRYRLQNTFGEQFKQEYTTVGEPTTLQDAIALAEENKYQFQFWALGLVGARPAASEEKKGADKGIDGRLYFHDELRGDTKQIVISVKSGKLKADDVRAIGYVREREGAACGVLITLQKPTQQMLTDAAASGFYTDPHKAQFPRVQILTVSELMAGATLNYPRYAINQTFKQAPRMDFQQISHNEALFDNDDDE
jgi:DNA modification methylase